MNKKRKAISLVLVVTMVLTVFFSGCAIAAPAAPIKGIDGRLVDTTEITGLDFYQQGTAGNYIPLLTGSPLLSKSLDGQSYVPNACKSFKVSKDGKTITITLDPSMKFYTGQKVTTADVIGSFEWCKQYSINATPLEAVKSYSSKGNDVYINLKAPTPSFLVFLSKQFSAILDVSVAKKMGPDAFNKKPVFYGPYYVVKWTQGVKAELARSEYFQNWDPTCTNHGPMYSHYTTVRFISNPTTVLMEFLQGNFDFVPYIPSQYRPMVASNPKIIITKTLEKGAAGLSLNPTSDVLKDINIRKAIAMAIDKNEVLKVWGGPTSGKIANSLISSSGKGYSKEVEAYFAKVLPVDVTKSKQLLASAGYTDTNGDGKLEKNGKVLTIKILTTAGTATVDTMYQALLQRVGIDAVLDVQEIKAYLEKLQSGNYDIVSDSTNRDDPSELYTKFANYKGFYSNSKVASAMKAMSTAPSVASQNKAVVVALKLLADQALYVPVFSPYSFGAAQSYMQGMKINSNDEIDWSAHLYDLVRNK